MRTSRQFNSRIRYVAQLDPPTPATLRKSAEEVSFLPMEAVGDDGSLDMSITRPAQEVASGYTYASDGDLLVAKVTPCFENGKAAIVSGATGGAAFATTEVYALRPQGKADCRFLYYALRSEHFRSYGIARLEGAGGLKRLSSGDLRDFPLWLPALPEQRAIADFLDRETAKIDALIEKQNALVSLLLERRSGALAALLDVDAVASPGPRFKHHIASVRQGWSPQCNDWPAEDGSWAVLRAGCINGGWFRPWDNKELPDDLEPRKETVVRVGDLVVSRANTRELVGGAAVVHDPHPRLMLSDKLYAFALRKSANPDFVALVLRTRRYRDLIELEATGASPSMQNITQEVLRSLPMSLPDRQAQDQLVGEATSRMQKTDALIAKAEEFIALARERRAALITAAVTGQIDVIKEAS